MFDINSRDLIAMVIVYHPDVEKLINNINRYIQLVNRLLIWQNSSVSEKDRETVLQRCYDSNKIVFMGSGANQGLSYALNEGLKYSIRHNYNYFMSMDQDSYWINFPDYLDSINALSLPEKTAIIGPRVLNLDKYSTLTNEAKNHYEAKQFVITSGAIYKTRIVNEIGGFNSSYFIDAIDEELCLKARYNGYNTIVVNAGLLGQHFGNYSEITIFGKTISCSNYTAFRYYHIVRNHIWLCKSGFLSHKERRLVLYNYVISPLIKVALFENDKITKLSAMIKGVIIGITLKPEEYKS